MEFAAWNTGNAAVLAGVLTQVVPLVDAGGAVLFVALALLVHGVRGAGAAYVGGARWLRYAFRSLVLVVLVSIPVGLLLARLAPG